MNDVTYGNSSTQYGRRATKCICCVGGRLHGSPAILMPFLVKRIFGYDPVEITAEWRLRDLREGMAYFICSTLECVDCGAIFLDYRFSDRELSLLYDDYRGTEYNALRTYFEPGYQGTVVEYTGRARYVENVEKYLSKFIVRNPTVLDWGGDSGINTPFRFAAESLHVFDISGVEVVNGAKKVKFEDCLKENYDLVVCSQVLEHVSNPILVLEQMRGILSCNTILYIEVPYEDLFKTSSGKKNIGYLKKHWHEHVNFFSPESLTALVRISGLTIIDQQIMPVSLGWRESAIQTLVCKL